MITSNPNLPSYVRAEALAIAPELTVVHDLLGGTQRMWEESSTYIRKWKAEDDAVYDIRRQCETVFEGLARTLSAATGMLFAKPPALTWNASEAAITPHWDNVDGAGTKGTVFAKRFAEAALRDGLGLILVDHPPAPVNPDGARVIVTAANEAKYNLRPTWAKYGRASVLNWRVGVVDNRTAPTMLVLAESADVDDGTFGTTTVPRFRELRLILTPTGNQATWRLWELVDDAGDKPESFREVSGGVFRNRLGQIAESLPIAIAYTGRTEAPLTATIPLMGVAWANLAHWQIATNLRFNRDVCGFEQLVVIGELMADGQTGKPGTLKIGPLVGVHLVEGGDVKWISPEGKGLAQLEAGKREKLTEMAQQGVSFLQTDTRAAETAEAKRLDATAENSTLATAAQGIEDAFNTALEIHAWYLGIAKVGAPVLTISRDYESTGMPAPMLTAWVGAIANAGLPVRLLLSAMQTGGLIPADTDLEELESEIMANQAAIEEQKALALQEQMDANTPPPAEQKPRRFAVERGADGRATGIAEAA